MSATMTLADFRRYLNKLGQSVAGADGAIVRGIHSGVMRSISVVHTATDNAPPASANGGIGAVNTAAYKGAWQFSLGSTGGRLFNTSPYGPFIEGGRKAGSGMPPVRAIEIWARRRLGLSVKEAKSAAFGIALAIKRRGLRPRHVLGNVRGDIVRGVLVEVRAEVQLFLANASNIP